jgi:hypothetical protein
MDWLKQRTTTLLGALTLRRVIALPIMFAVVAAAVRAGQTVTAYLLEHEWRFVGLPPWAFGLFALLLLLIYFLIEYANRLRTELEPKLKVCFDRERGCLVDSPVQHYQDQPSTLVQGAVQKVLIKETRALFARIRADALSRTKVLGCSAFITAIESRIEAGATFTKYPIQDPIPLSTHEVDVSPRVPCFWDFITVSQETGSVPQFPVPIKLTLRDAIKQPGTYRFTMQVVGEGVTSEQKVEMDWTGDPTTVEFRAL